MAVSLEDPDDGTGEEVALALTSGQAGHRLDKALAEAAAAIPGLSRSRLVHLIAAGAVRDPEGRTVTEPRAKVKSGEWRVSLPAPAPARASPEPIPLDIVHEDEALIVVDKPAGMVVHPAPGAEHGTLVNALLHHCGSSLTGIGDEARPGIVHRIDKDTSGLLVVAKTQGAHEALARLFAAHEVDRRYLALVWGVPDAADPRLGGVPGVTREAGGVTRIDRALARHPTDRKRMAVVAGGRRAVTRMRLIERFELARAGAALVECRLETGRTHQIRVHAAHAGHPLIGDPVYGRARTLPESAPESVRNRIRGFGRQALHAAGLGFAHPVTETWLSFEAPMPEDMADLLCDLRRRWPSER